MRRIGLARILGTVALLLGLEQVWVGMVEPMVSTFFRRSPVAYYIDYMFALIILPIMGLPGMLLVVYGFRLLKHKTKRNIKGTVGAFACFAAFWLNAKLGRMSTAPLVIRDFSPLIATMFMVPVYVFVSRFVMMKEGLVPAKGEFIGKGIAVIVALAIAISGDQSTEAIPADSPWGLVRLVPLLVAGLFYGTSRLVIERVKDKEQDEAEGEPKSFAAAD